MEAVGQGGGLVAMAVGAMAKVTEVAATVAAVSEAAASAAAALVAAAQGVVVTAEVEKAAGSNRDI